MLTAMVLLSTSPKKEEIKISMLSVTLTASLSQNKKLMQHSLDRTDQDQHERYA
jgi:hypothetical protein